MLHQKEVNRCWKIAIFKENEYINKKELGRALEEIEKGLVKIKN